MNCGEFEQRNTDYYNNFSPEKYFRQLVLGNTIKREPPSLDWYGQGKTIFDVGSHKGESAIFFHGIFPESKIYSFEPIPFAAENIINLALKNVSVFQMALSDFNGSADFYVQDISHLSSLNKINRKSKHSMGYASDEKHKKITVDVVRGDTFIKSRDIVEIDLLKIDVQANEVKTIQGFSDVLDKIKIVFVEVSFYDFYDNRSVIKNIEASLPSFEFYDIYEISKNLKTLGTDWATLVYKNQNL